MVTPPLREDLNSFLDMNSMMAFESSMKNEIYLTYKDLNS